MTDELEHGGIWHTSGTLPCATGQPYPHNNTPECRMTDQPITPEQADQAAARVRHLHGINYNHSDIRDTLRRLGMPSDEAALNAVLPRLHSDAFELPTVAALRQQLAEYEQLFELQHTRTREADARWRAEDPDTRANTHPDLGVLLTWLMADADGQRDRATKAERERDSLARRCAVWFEETKHLTADRQALQAVITELQAELGEAQTEVAAMHRIAEGVDQIRATVVSRLGSIRNAAHNLIDALDEGDIDTIGRIERLREALYATEGSEDDTRMDLTDKGREILDSTPGASADGSVPDVAREDSSNPDTVVDVKSAGESITPSVTHPTRSMHKGHYGVPETGETGEAPEPQESDTTERYMMATVAHHQLGDISRPEPNLVLITGEDGDNWVGSWVEGYGYFNVRFPKSTTRGLTDAEVQAYDGSLLDVGASRYVIRIPATGGVLGMPPQTYTPAGCVIPPLGEA